MEHQSVIDGKALASNVLARAKARATKHRRSPELVIITANETPATKSYLAIKEKKALEAGCTTKIVRLSNTANTTDLIKTVLDASKRADAVVVQLPLSARVDTKAVIDMIPIDKDADALSASARTCFESVDLRSQCILPPVVGAMREIFTQHGVQVAGERAVVIGDGRLVGVPCAIWLKQQGADVEVITLDTQEAKKLALLRSARIIVSGTGSPHSIQPDMLTSGAVLVDAGTSEQSGKIVGDADPACANVCSLFTPVPGGVGPLAVACLFDNVTRLV